MDKKQIRKNFVKICEKRDHYRCRKCRTQIGEIQVHHITDRKEMPNGGYVKENGITLCPECHFKAELYHITSGEQWVPGYHPNDLYKIIDSSYEQARLASEKLSG